LSFGNSIDGVNDGAATVEIKEDDPNERESFR
jgi:hypothetical protein